MLRRENGVTIEELMVEFGWQAHSARGAISIDTKRLGVAAERVEKGRYRIPGRSRSDRTEESLGFMPGGLVAFMACYVLPASTQTGHSGLDI